MQLRDSILTHHEQDAWIHLHVHVKQMPTSIVVALKNQKQECFLFEDKCFMFEDTVTSNDKDERCVTQLLSGNYEMKFDEDQDWVEHNVPVPKQQPNCLRFSSFST
jgi:hypothetical protein